MDPPAPPGEERGGAASTHLSKRPGGRQGHGNGASGSGRFDYSGEHERVELSKTEVLPQGEVPYLRKPAAARGRKRSMSLEALSLAAEGLAEVEKADEAWPVVERAGGGWLTLVGLRQIFLGQLAPARLEASTLANTIGHG